MNNKLSRNILTTAMAAAIFALAGCAPVNNEQEEQVTVSHEEAVSKISAVVEQTSNGDFRVADTFEGPENLDLMGILVEPVRGGNQMVAWATKDGEYFLPGPVFNSNNNENINDNYVEVNEGISAEELAGSVIGRGFVAGTSGPIITAFFEPYCGFCNRLFEEINPMVENGEIRVRYLMVGFLTPDAPSRAALIHYANDPQQALKEWEESPNKSDVEQAQAPDEQLQTIQEHSELMFSAGLNGTPALVYCNGNTGEVEKVSGMPSNVEAFVSQASEDGHEACS